MRLLGDGYRIKIMIGDGGLPFFRLAEAVAALTIDRANLVLYKSMLVRLFLVITWHVCLRHADWIAVRSKAEHDLPKVFALVCCGCGWYHFDRLE